MLTQCASFYQTCRYFLPVRFHLKPLSHSLSFTHSFCFSLSVSVTCARLMLVRSFFFFTRWGSRVCHETVLAVTRFLTSNKCSIYFKAHLSKYHQTYFHVCICPFLALMSPLQTTLLCDTMPLLVNCIGDFLLSWRLTWKTVSEVFLPVKSIDTVSLATLELNRFFLAFYFTAFITSERCTGQPKCVRDGVHVRTWMCHLLFHQC